MIYCYILDLILILYGMILTVLYLRLRIHSAKNLSHAKKQPVEEGIYSGLTSHTSDTYETIRGHEKPKV